jgi:DNA mismatch repair protein MutH
MKIVTRATAIKNLKKYIGKDLAKLAPQFGIHPFKGGKQNKGWKGLVLERLAGLEPNVSKAPNGLTYELKSVSFHYKGKELVPKETMAITMINPEELKSHSFFESHVWAKLKSMVFCAVMWHGKNSRSAELLNVASLDFAQDDELIKEIKADYDFIRAKLVKHGFHALTGKDGKWIQARTKGTGGINPRTGKRRPITRAFYARTRLVKRIFEIAS